MMGKIIRLVKRKSMPRGRTEHCYCVSIRSDIDHEILKHLKRDDGQEDICFALYKVSNGGKRTHFLIYKIILPEDGDRLVHGNVEIKKQYFQRALSIAQEEQAGIAILHSHPCGYDWQDMSKDDVILEKGMLSNKTFGCTKKYLVGLTLSGKDNFWSARAWVKTNKGYSRENCLSVKTLRNNNIILNFHRKHQQYRHINCADYSYQKRTIDSWGEQNQEMLINTRIGIVGLGSVGSMVAESLARSGVRQFTLIDDDKVERKNLDRHMSATLEDIGKLKVDVVKRRIEKICTSRDIEIISKSQQVGKRECIELLCDCDVILCCVDNHNARHILNTISHTQFIPIVEGGLLIEPLYKKKKVQAIHTIAMKASSTFPRSRCLLCLKRYEISEANQRKSERYITTMETRQYGENVFCFSSMLASLQVSYFLSLLFGTLCLRNYKVILLKIERSEMRIEEKENNNNCCNKNCFTESLLIGDDAKEKIPSEIKEI